MRSARLVRLGMLFLVVALAAHTAEAVSVYDTSALGELTGSRSVGSGLTAGTDWGNAAIGWVITDLSDHYQYVYTFSDMYTKNISHISLDITDDAVSGNDLEPGTVTDAVWSYTVGGVPQTSPASFDGEPNKDGIIGLVKFEPVPEGYDDDLVLTFLSNRAPVYGDIYVKDGLDLLLYNDGISDHESEDIQDFIARPDGAPGGQPPYIPEPLTMLGALGGIASLAGYVRRRRRPSP